MNDKHPFSRSDLDELDERLLSKASAVVAMQVVHAGNHGMSVIGYRHDCDAGHSLATAVKMAEWEAERGYRSSYYILHTSPYWGWPEFRESLERIAVCGHEIGIHADAIAEALLTGRDPDLILDEALERLRSYGFPVRGVAGHGNKLCYPGKRPGEVSFANDEQFEECRRPKEGAADREIVRGQHKIRLRPRPLADFGLDYSALWLSIKNPFRLSDSGGHWVDPGWEPSVEKFHDLQSGRRPHHVAQMHLLVHPDWWADAVFLSAVTL